MTEIDSEREAGLILQNMGLVVSITQQFISKESSEYEDYLQAGSIGLLKAIRTFDPSKAVLSTWAHKHIKWEIIRHIEKLNKERKKELLYSQSEWITLDKTKIYTGATSYLLELLPDNLTESEREALVLRIAGYNLTEIRDILNLNNSYAISVIFSSAIKKIKEANKIR